MGMSLRDEDVKLLVKSESGAASAVDEGLTIFCGISSFVEANRLGMEFNRLIDLEEVRCGEELGH